MELFLDSRGLSYVLDAPESIQASGLGDGPADDAMVARWGLRIEPVGARAVRPEGRVGAPARLSYFRGPRASWRVGARTYREVVYRQLWPGIDLVLSLEGDRLKQSFVVEPGADPGQIRAAVRGAEAVRLGDDGSLVLETPYQTIQDHPPVAFQEIGGVRRAVGVELVLEQGTVPGQTVYRFELTGRDPDHPLIIDPATIVAAGFVGGSGNDYARAVALDGQGNALVVGSTFSTQSSFPVTTGPFLTHSGSTDVFVAKVLADGSGLDWCGFIGGTGLDQSQSIAVDAAGNAYIAGTTDSTEASFPVTVGPDLTFNGSTSYDDAFVAKIAADGTALIYCGYIGGGRDDSGYGIAVDASGAAYVTGPTSSNQLSFPVLVGPDLTIGGSASDAYVAKVVPDGTALQYCGYIGGTSSDVGWSIAVDATSRAYVTGYTTSLETGGFPVVVGPDLTFNDISSVRGDAFVARVDADGSQLEYCGYIGGDGTDRGYGIAVDDAGCAYVTGTAASTEATFPVRVGPDLTHNDTSGPYGDGFVAKVTADGSDLVYCGYIGGSTWFYESILGIDVDPDGNAYVAGYTSASQTSFPVVDGPDLTYNTGQTDAFVARVRSDGTQLDYCGYIGGNSSWEEEAWGVAVEDDGTAWVVGFTGSTQSTFPVTVGPDLSFNGGNLDGFVAKIAFCGQTLELTSGVWSLLSVPCAPGGTVGELLGDDGLGTYGTDWAVIERDASSDTYRTLGVDDPLVQGAGYWIKALGTSPVIDVAGAHTDSGQAFAVALVDDTDPGRWNLVGNPFAFPVDWADIEIHDVLGAVSYLISDTASGDLITNRTAFVWNGASYQSIHPVSNPIALDVFDGFWVRTRAPAELRIPPTPSGTEERAPAASWSGPDEWYLQLAVDADDLADPGNRIGRLAGASDGEDETDLEELEPFGTPYLTLVMPHPEWQGTVWSYTTDVREARPRAGGIWTMEVRSDVPRPITVSWTAGGAGAADILARSRLVDPDNGAVIEPDAAGTYTVTMSGTSHELLWKVDSLPTVEAGDARTTVVGRLLRIDASYDDEDQDDQHTATVSWGDGTVEPAQVDPQLGLVRASHAYGSAGERAVELCVTDSIGAVACDTVAVTVLEPDAPLFMDDFESSGTSAWSKVVG